MKLHAFLLAMVGAVVLAGSAVPAEAQYHHHHYHHHHYHHHHHHALIVIHPR